MSLGRVFHEGGIAPLLRSCRPSRAVLGWSHHSYLFIIHSGLEAFLYRVEFIPTEGTKAAPEAVNGLLGAVM